MSVLSMLKQSEDQVTAKYPGSSNPRNIARRRLTDGFYRHAKNVRKLRYLLGFVDIFTGWVEIVSYSTQKASEVTKTLFKRGSPLLQLAFLNME